MKPKKIKLFWTLGLTATLLASATVALSILWPRLFPSLYVSDLYRRYENNEYIRATEIHNFPVNDILAVDVTTLQATDSAGWETLKKDFHIAELSPQAIEMLKHTESTVGVRLTPKNDIGASCDTANLDNNNILAIDYQQHSVGYFHTKNKEENFQILHYHYNLSEK